MKWIIVLVSFGLSFTHNSEIFVLGDGKFALSAPLTAVADQEESLTLPEEIFPREFQTPEQIIEAEALCRKLDEDFGVWSPEQARERGAKLLNELIDIAMLFVSNRKVAQKWIEVLLINEKTLADLELLARNSSSQKVKEGALCSQWRFPAFYTVLSRDQIRQMRWPEVREGYEAISRLRPLLGKFSRLTQWDLFNRFKGAYGILLWRAGKEIEQWEKHIVRLPAAKNSTERSQLYSARFFNTPGVVKKLAEKSAKIGENNPIVLMFVPFSSIKATFWVTEMSNNNLIEINGVAYLVDILFLDSKSDLARLKEWQTQYEWGAERTSYWEVDQVNLNLSKEVMSQL